jgi:hypothetical protein
MTESDNLPAIVRTQGGAVVAVLSWPQHLELLTPKQQKEVGRMVMRYPGLATESGVDLIAEAAGHYGERLDKWFEAIVEDYGIEVVYRAIETLDALGRRGRPDTSAERDHEAERFELDEMLGLVSFLEELNRSAESSEALQGYIERLGGWEVARLLGANQIEGLLSGELEIGEVRAAVNAPEIDEDARNRQDRNDDEE